MTGPDRRTSILGGLEFSIPGFLGVGKFGKKCTLLLNLPEYRVTGVSWLDEEERSERSDSKGPFLLSSFRLSSPSSPPFAARLL